MSTPAAMPPARGVEHRPESGQILTRPSVTGTTGITRSAQHRPSPGPGRRPTPRPATPAATLADHLQAAANVIRGGVSVFGCTEPAAVLVSADGVVTVELGTEQLLEWSRAYEGRPRVTGYDGHPYLSVSGRVGGQVWRMHTGHPEPEPAATGDAQHDTAS